MKIYRSLLFILLTVFVLGVGFICLATPASIWSRIATGLITGSFVGIVSTLTNYFHIRQVYFEKMVMTLWDVERNLSSDYIQAKARNSYIAEMHEEQIIRHTGKYTGVEESKAVSDKMEARYRELASKFDFEAFIPLLPWTGHRLKIVLEELDDLINYKLVNLNDEYRMCFDFNLLSSSVSKEEQKMVLGDSEEFFDFVVQENKDYEDMIAFYLDNLANLSDSLSSGLDRVLSKKYKDMLSMLSSTIRKVYLKDAVIRDVHSEQVNAIEKKWAAEDSE